MTTTTRIFKTYILIHFSFEKGLLNKYGIYYQFWLQNRKYYEKDALVADPEYGSVLSHLLGKCKYLSLDVLPFIGGSI